MSNRRIEVKLSELTNELELVPSNTSLLVERVPIEFADFTFKLPGNSTSMYSTNQSNPFNSNIYTTQATENTQKGLTTEGYPKSQIIPSISSLANPIKTGREGGDLGSDMHEIQKHLAARGLSDPNGAQRMYHNQAEPYPPGQKPEQPEAVFTVEEYEKALDTARYFIIRSSNQENIFISRQQNEWATTRSNEGKLNEAFNSSRFVFLIFAVSKTFHFQGVALMTSATSNKGGSYWKNIDTIKLGGCFKVKWINYSILSFNRIANLTNPYCDNEPVKKSRDCTEIEPKVGKELCQYFEMVFRDKGVPSPLPPFFFNNLKVTNDPLSLITKPQTFPDSSLGYEGDRNKISTLYHSIRDLNKQEGNLRGNVNSQINTDSKDGRTTGITAGSKQTTEIPSNVKNNPEIQTAQPPFLQSMTKSYPNMSEKELQEKFQEFLNAGKGMDHEKDKDRKKQKEKKKKRRSDSSSERSESRKKSTKRKRHDSSESRDRHHKGKSKSKKR
jgi:hypothetical protein